MLVYPPSSSQRHESCPAGLLMLAAVLERAGCVIRIIDANAARCRLSNEQIAERAAEFRPHVIGITLVTPLVREAYRLAGMLRPLGARLLAGGPHATILPGEPLAHGFDAVVLGEGEATVEEAVRALVGQISPGQVKGWVYRGPDGAICRTEPRGVIEDLDSLPPPARHLVRVEDYGTRADGPLHANLFTSRGCPARCAYCAGDLFGKRFRFRSAEGIAREMQDLHRTYATRHFHFMDDAMTVDKTRVKALCGLLRDHPVKFTWSMMTRIDMVNRELLEVAASAGCVQIDFGVESGCPDTLRRVHKPHTVEMVKRVIADTADVGIRPYVFFILGFPWGGLTELERTRRLMEELAPYVDCFHPAVASILIPFPGTEIYERYKGEYGFENWWLDDARAYDAPNVRRHSFFERRVFSRGAVLDADFFRYPAAVRTGIRRLFRFMYLHNLRRAGRLTRGIHRAMLDLSDLTHRLSPALERVLFAPVALAEQAVGRR